MSQSPGLYTQVLNEFIMPPKMKYTEWDLPGFEVIAGQPTTRTDFKVTNCEGIQMACSVFHQEGKLKDQRDFVVYCHTREGNRVQGSFLRHLFLPETNVVCFDFSGSGNSQNDYVTLGIKEANDIASVTKYIHESFQPRNVALWGRSMGAVSTILFARLPENQKQISCLVLDSPFTNIEKLAEDVVKSKHYVPSFLIRCGLCCCVRSGLKKRTGVDVGGIDNCEAVQTINVPTIYVSGKEDKVAPQKRVYQLFQRHKSQKKQFLAIEAEHHSERNNQELKKVAGFVKSHLSVNSSRVN